MHGVNGVGMATMPDVTEDTRLNMHLRPDQLRRIVVVLTSGRTGSSLMSSLLDAHPAILSTPDSLLMGWYTFWQQHGHKSAAELVASFIRYYAVLFDARQPSQCPRTGPGVGSELNFESLGESHDHVLTADRERFQASVWRYLSPGTTVGRRIFFQVIHIAYADAIGHRVHEPPIMAFGLHMADPASVQMLLEDFPEAQFLHMVRDPIQALASQIKVHLAREAPNPRLMYTAMQYRLASGAPVDPRVAHQSRVVRLEDLHQRSREVMLAVCGWLGIAWSETCLRSTVNGVTWWNAKDSVQISGCSKAMVADRHADILPRFDRWRLTVLYYPRFARWGYFGHARWAGRRLVQLASLPMCVWRFQTEWPLWRDARAREAYLNARLMILKHMMCSLIRRSDAQVRNLLP